MDEFLFCITLCLLLARTGFGQMLVSNRKGVIVTSSSQIWDVYYVVDENADTKAQTCKCCGATRNESNPWYKVDLGQDYKIQRIRVIGRTDFSHTLYKMEIQLDTSESDGTVLQGVDTSSKAIHELDHTLTPPELARYITLTLRDVTVYFVICELYVYAVCNFGTYGMNCANTCGRCENNGACNNVDGTCTSCVTGYLSPVCKYCIEGRYGPTCDEHCGQCINNDACDNTDGICLNGCSAGYQGNTCKEDCEDGTYGPKCPFKCGNCFNNGPCNKIDGDCSSCAAGYEGTKCVDECQAGTFGFNCKQRCGICLNRDVCDIYTGECPNGCTDGYKGSQCLQEINQDATPCSDTCISLPVFIGSLFAVIAVYTTIVLAWLLYQRRQQKKPHKAATSADNPIQLPDTASNYDMLQFGNPAEESRFSELNRIS